MPLLFSSTLMTTATFKASFLVIIHLIYCLFILFLNPQCSVDMPGSYFAVIFVFFK